MPANSSNIQSAGDHQYDKTLPASWRQVSLDSVAVIYFSGVDKKSLPGERNVFLCNYMDVYNKEYVYGYENFMPATATDSEIARLSIKPGDVIITKDSETPDDIGIPAVVMAAPNNLVCGYHLALIRPRQNQVDSLFLAKQLAHHRISRYFGRLAKGMTRYGLATTVIESAPLWLPPIEEQRLISKALYTLDEAIQKTEQLIAKLKAIKQGLLHDLLTRGLNENGQLRDPVAHPEQFKDSPLGRIPKEWEVLSIKDISSVKGGKRLPKGHSYSTTPLIYRYLRVQDFFDKEVEYESLESLESATYEILKQYEINEGDLYISIAGSIGYAGVCRPLSNQKIILTENATRIVIINGMNPQYLAMQINSDIVQNQIKKEIGTGGGVPKLALHRIERLKIFKPPQDEQSRIVEYSNGISDNIMMEENYLSKLKLLKKGLMHDLLTGKVRGNIKEGNRDQVKGESLYDQNPAERRLS